MDKEAFIEWVNSHDGAITSQEIHTEWPEFFTEGYADNLFGVTVVRSDDGNFLYAKEDIRLCVTNTELLD